MNVVIIGGVAAGPKCAARIKRLRPDAQVTIIERDSFLSYAGCGLPYYISGEIHEQKELYATGTGAPRDAAYFQNVKGVKVLTRTEAVEIDRKARRVRIRSLAAGAGAEAESWIAYDKLLLATGASPVRPPLPGLDLKGVSTLHSIHDAEAVRARLAEWNAGAAGARRAVIVGGGLIGVEAAEALVERGCEVTLVEMLPQILRILDWEIAKLVENHMKSKGVRVLTGAKVEAFLGGDGGRLTGVRTSAGEFPADLALLSIGVRPNTALARAAGLELGASGGLRVDSTQRTSDPDIYAAGDCCEMKDLLTGQPCHVPLGSTANKQGRVAANAICGRPDSFPGVLGSTVCKVFDFSVARTGLTERQAREAGHEVVTVLNPGPDKAHYMPAARSLFMKIVVDARTRKLLGAQAAGPGAGDKRADVAAVAIAAGMTVDQVAHLDLCYAPPYAPAMDNLITSANIARNKLDGLARSLTPEEVKRRLDEKRDFVFLDVRGPKEWQQVRLAGSILIPLGELRGRLAEIPRDKEIVVFCAASLRGYEAARVLAGAGFERVAFLDGGVSMWPYEKLT